MNVLFVKLGAIGDAVMALSLVPALEAKYPGAKLTWMCGRGIEPLLRLFPQIHELVTVDEKTLFGPSKLKALGELIQLQVRLLGRRFDLVLHGNVDRRYRLLTAMVRGGETRGWNRHKSRPWPIPGRYHGDEYARLLNPDDAPGERRWNPPVPHLPTSGFVRDVLQGTGRLIVIAPGGAKNVLADSSLRRWPVENYVALARRLVACGHRVVLTGGETDRWVQPAFANIPHIDLVGRTSLPELLSVYSLSSLVVSHDTSSVHLPRLVGTPVVALFGPTMPAQFFPANAKGQAIWGGEHLACRPCYDGRNYAACRKNSCMMSISVERVFGVVEAICGTLPALPSKAVAEFRPAVNGRPSPLVDSGKG